MQMLWGVNYDTGASVKCTKLTWSHHCALYFSILLTRHQNEIGAFIQCSWHSLNHESSQAAVRAVSVLGFANVCVLHTYMQKKMWTCALLNHDSSGFSSRAIYNSLTVTSQLPLQVFFCFIHNTWNISLWSHFEPLLLVCIKTHQVF